MSRGTQSPVCLTSSMRSYFNAFHIIANFYIGLFEKFVVKLRENLKQCGCIKLIFYRVTYASFEEEEKSLKNLFHNSTKNFTF